MRHNNFFFDYICPYVFKLFFVFQRNLMKMKCLSSFKFQAVMVGTKKKKKHKDLLSVCYTPGTDAFTLLTFKIGIIISFYK